MEDKLLLEIKCDITQLYIPSSLLPPSCIVALIRELGNITLSNTTLHSTTYNMAWIQDTDIAVDSIKNLFTDDEMRGHLLALSVYRPRSPSISSSISNEEYYVCVKRDSNRINKNKSVSSIGNSQVEYETWKRKKDQVSKIANNANC